MKACNILIRYCDVLRDRANIIKNANGKYLTIAPCHPYIEGLVWSSEHMNIKALNEFKIFFINNFGTEVFENS